MKHFLLVIFLVFAGIAYGQTWVQKASLPITDGIQGCFSFTINGKLYVGGGYDNILGNVVDGFYEYDPATNTWTTKASVPQAVGTNDGFALNGMGYIACGVVSGIVLSTFVYMYDPITNTWTQKNNFPGAARQNHVCFSLNGYGYMYGGFTGGTIVVNEMWEYNPTTDTWVQKASSPAPSIGPGRNGPTYLNINNTAYVGMGGTVNGSNAFADFYLFNPGTIGVSGSGSYTAVASIPVGRECGAFFTIGNTGYVGIGWGGSSYLNDFYSFDPSTNTWSPITNFGGGARQHPFSQAVNGEPYVGCGDNASGNNLDNWTWAICNIPVNLGPDTNLCNGASLILRDTFSNASSLWSTGDTTSSITVTTSGTYWLKVTQGTCTGADTINITVSTAPPPFSLGHDTTYCGSFSRVLSTGLASTLWSTGATAAQINVTSPGTYWAQETNSCGSVRDTIVISENLIPVVNLGNDTTLCQGDDVILNAGNAGATFLWQNSTTAQTLTVTSQGTYWVNVTVSGCTKRDSILVSYVSPLPPFSIGKDTAYCGFFSRILSTGVISTLWSNGSLDSSIIIDSAGIYWAQESNACGSVRDSIAISEKPLPVVDLGNDTSICPDHDVILNAGNPGAVYLWQNHTTGQTLTVDSPGTYWVDVTVNGCTAPDTIRISGLLPPSAFTIGSDTTICEDSLLILNAFQPNSAFIWSTGDTSASIAVSQTGQYQVTDTNSCGAASASVSVTVVGCVCKIAIPTAFSPNNDGKNDQFWVLTQCPLKNFEMNIYNRWGQLIFTGYAVTDKWDGTYKGHQQPLGVYVYFVHYTDPYTGKVNSQSGNVTLVR